MCIMLSKTTSQQILRLHFKGVFTYYDLRQEPWNRRVDRKKKFHCTCNFRKRPFEVTLTSCFLVLQRHPLIRARYYVIGLSDRYQARQN